MQTEQANINAYSKSSHFHIHNLLRVSFTPSGRYPPALQNMLLFTSSDRQFPSLVSNSVDHAKSLPLLPVTLEPFILAYVDDCTLSRNNTLSVKGRMIACMADTPEWPIRSHWPPELAPVRGLVEEEEAPDSFAAASLPEGKYGKNVVAIKVVARIAVRLQRVSEKYRGEVE